jgi:hypothetical protein
MRAKIILMALASLLIVATMARAQLSMMGIGPAGSGVAAVGCAATGFRFLNSCNSQYATVIHF